MAYTLTGDPEDAQDLAQDVFIRVYRNLCERSAELVICAQRKSW